MTTPNADQRERREECQHCGGDGTIQSETHTELYNTCPKCDGLGKSNPPENREVFAADEIPFEVALDVVVARLNLEHAKLIKAGHRSVSVAIFGGNNYPIHLSVRGHYESGKSLDELLLKVPPPEDTKAKEIKELRERLAALESEAKGEA